MTKITVNQFEQYKNLGLSIVGIPKANEYKNEKGESKKKVIFPRGGWAQFQKELATKDEILGFVERGCKMIGLVTGELSGIVVIDVDEENSDKYDFLQSPMTATSSLSGGKHYYFRWTEDLDQFGNATKVMGYKMDYRGRGGLIFAPGSIVRKLDGTNGTYDFDGEMNLENFDREQLPELPDEILINLSEEKREVIGESYLEETEHGLVLPELHEGERNSETARVIGSVLKKTDPSIWEGVIWPAIRIWNQEKVHPPQDEGALRATFRQITNNERRKRDQELIFDVEEKTDFRGILESQLLEQTDKFFLSEYKSVDKVIGGFRYKNTYLVGGLEKSGKSSWLMQMLQLKLNKGIRIGYVNTEMPILEFASRMAAYWKKIEYDQVTDELIVQWSEKFAGRFSYLGVETLETQEKMIEDIKVIVKNVECLVFDNITSWGLKLVKGKDSWQITADLIGQLLTITKNNPIVTFMVMHMRPDIVVNSVLRANLKALQEYKDDPESIFEKSESFVRKPTLADLYGGGSVLSQISGAILIWRPYQKFANENMNACTQILLESFRHSKQAAITAYFNGKTGKFSDDKFEEFNQIVEVADKNQQSLIEDPESIITEKPEEEKVPF